MASIYAVYYVLRKRALYGSTITPGKALTAIFRGILKNPITKLAKENM